MLDETLAREIFGNTDPLGKRVTINGRAALVIGLTKEESGFPMPADGKKRLRALGLLAGNLCGAEITQLEGSTVKKEDVPQTMAQAVKILERRHQVKDRDKAVSLEQQMQVAGKINRHHHPDHRGGGGHLPAGRRHRRDEHHARLCHRKNAGNRHPDGPGRPAAGHLKPVFN